MKYKIRTITQSEIDNTFAVLFAFGFVFTTHKRIRDYESVKAEHSINEREEWNWIITGYDEECQRVFGVMSLYSYESYDFRDITLDDFLWEMVEEMQNELTDTQPTEGSTPSEYFKFTQPI